MNPQSQRTYKTAQKSCLSELPVYLPDMFSQTILVKARMYLVLLFTVRKKKREKFRWSIGNQGIRYRGL